MSGVKALVAVGVGVLALVALRKRASSTGSGRYYFDKRYSLPVTSNPVDGRDGEKPPRTGGGVKKSIDPKAVFRLESGYGDGRQDPNGVYGIDWGLAWIDRGRFSAVRLAALERGDATFTMRGTPPGGTLQQAYIFASVTGKIMRRLY